MQGTPIAFKKKKYSRELVKHKNNFFFNFIHLRLVLYVYLPILSYTTDER